MLRLHPTFLPKVVFDYGIDIPRIRDEACVRAAVHRRTVLVTGASSGIGRALAKKLGALGAHVLLVARSKDKLERVACEIREAGGRAHVYVADLKTGSGVDTLLEALARDGVEVEILINNAGRSIRRALEDAYDRAHDFERTMALNYFAAVRLTLGVLPGMRARRYGQIVNVSSSAVQHSLPRFSAYVASKAALDAFTRVAAIETRADGVHFSTVHMPLVRTPMSAPTFEFANLPSLSPEEAADALLYALVHKRIRLAPWRGSFMQILQLLAPELTTRALSAVTG